MTVSPRVRELVEPVVAASHLELFDIDQHGSTLVVTVDRPGGVDLEALTAATRAISRALDEGDPITGRYTLEVSSPGLERKLRTPAHFGWAIDRTVAVKTVAAFDGPRRLTGTITGVDAHGVTLQPDVAGTPTVHIAYSDIDTARTTFEWGPRPKPGSDNRRVEAS